MLKKLTFIYTLNFLYMINLFGTESLQELNNKFTAIQLHANDYEIIELNQIIDNWLDVNPDLKQKVNGELTNELKEKIEKAKREIESLEFMDMPEDNSLTVQLNEYEQQLKLITK